jgi:hypothetical protein
VGAGDPLTCHPDDLTHFAIDHDGGLGTFLAPRADRSEKKQRDGWDRQNLLEGERPFSVRNIKTVNRRLSGAMYR